VEGNVGTKLEKVKVEEGGGVASHHSMDLVALGEEEFGQVGAILARDAGD
jgi:hypothetical protein